MPTEEEIKLAKAFNIGYVLSQHEPKILDKIIESNKDNEIIQMIAAGKRQQEKEKLVADQKEMLFKHDKHKHKR